MWNLNAARLAGLWMLMSACESEYAETRLGQIEVTLTSEGMAVVPADEGDETTDCARTDPTGWAALGVDGHCVRLIPEAGSNGEDVSQLSVWVQTEQPGDLARVDVTVGEEDSSSRPFALERSVADAHQFDLLLQRYGEDDATVTLEFRAFRWIRADDEEADEDAEESDPQEAEPEPEDASTPEE